MRKPLFYTIILFLAFVVYFMYRDKFLNLESIQKELEFILIYKQKFPIRFLLIFQTLYLFLTSFSIPGSILLTLLAGIVFGNLWGSLLVTLNGAIGATIAFFLARFFLKNYLMNKFGYQFYTMDKSFKKNGLWYLWMLRMIPGSPFVIINMFMGLTNIRAVSFFTVTFIGMLPGNFIFVYAGHRLLEINSPWEVLTPQMILILLLLGIVPVLLRHVRDT